MTLEQVFYHKYPKTAQRILYIYTEANGERATWEGLTKATVATFIDNLTEEVAPSSARTYSAQFKAVVNLYQEECINLKKGWEKMLTVKNDVSEQIYLTDEELKRVIAYVPETDNEMTVQQQFILSCLVGARHGDIVKLTEKNIRDGYVCYVSEKTHNKAQVPLSDVAGAILRGEFRKCATGHIFPTETLEYKAYRRQVADSTYNRNLRDICRKCGINEEITLYKRGQNITAEKWTFASSHTGRRTCATLLYLHGCDIYSISRILAHSSVEMTAAKYIMCPIRTLSEETMGYFSQFNK